MRANDLYQALASTGLPVAYGFHSPPANPPYLVYLIPEHTPIGADNMTALEVLECRVELYTDKRDFETELRVEQCLSSAGARWESKENDYISDESLYMTTYEFQLFQRGAYHETAEKRRLNKERTGK